MLLLIYIIILSMIYQYIILLNRYNSISSLISCIYYLSILNIDLYNGNIIIFIEYAILVQFNISGYYYNTWSSNMW